MADHSFFPKAGPTMQVYQDELPDTQPMNSHAPMPTSRPASRRILGDADPNAALKPPQMLQPPAFSPKKAKSSSHLASATSVPPHIPTVWQHAPMMPNHFGHPEQLMTDSLQKKPYLSNFKTSKQKSASTVPYATQFDFDKENAYAQAFASPQEFNFSIQTCYPKGNGKRGLLDAAPIKDARPAKKAKTDNNVSGQDVLPRTATDASAKPPQSYAQLIAMAIMSVPDKRLTLHNIYQWISDHFAYYRMSESGWQNSIRHNLSLHKQFVKVERPKDEPGKGNYWSIEEGAEAQFLKEKPARKAIPTAENLPVMSTLLEPSNLAPGRPATAPAAQVPQSESGLPPLPMSGPAPHTSSHFDSAITQQLGQDLSSDATIPASDNVSPDDSLPLIKEATSQPSGANSCFPPHIGSSPPPRKLNKQNRATPSPTGAEMRPPSRCFSSTHRRNNISLDETANRAWNADSGYISGMDSSVIRQEKVLRYLETEASRPHKARRKSGRAEEEIKRLRSSPISPTKSRSRGLLGNPLGSSPSGRKNPLTPRGKRALMQPPPSNSPNTNLRLHRAKLQREFGSPVRVRDEDDDSRWSPRFRLDDLTDQLGSGEEFDIFNDADPTSFPATGFSPLKMPTTLSRSKSTPTVATIKSGRKLLAQAPSLKPPMSPSAMFDTPSRVFSDLDSPSKCFSATPLRPLSTPSKALFNMPAVGDWSALTLDAHDFLGADFAFTEEDVPPPANLIVDENTINQGPAATQQPSTGFNNEDASSAGFDISLGFAKIGSKAAAKKPPMARSQSTRY